MHLSNENHNSQCKYTTKQVLSMYIVPVINWTICRRFIIINPSRYSRPTKIKMKKKMWRKKKHNKYYDAFNRYTLGHKAIKPTPSTWDILRQFSITDFNNFILSLSVIFLSFSCYYSGGCWFTAAITIITYNFWSGFVALHVSSK